MLHARRATRHRPVTLLIVGLLVAACGAPSITASPSPSAVAIATPSPSPSPNTTPTPTPVPASPSPTPLASIVPAVLSGVMVDRPLAERLPLAVMIDDARASRPQSGFNAASIVYQAPADGYESRYMMIFQEGETRAIGPVRSARFFLVQWASEVEAALSHYGGDRRSRSYIKAHNKKYFTDVDALGRGSSAYHRIRTRRAPHNGYTSTKELRRVALKLGASKAMDTDVFRRPFRDPSALADRGAAGEWIRIPYWTNVISYRYHRSSNAYRRSVDGRAQTDPADGKRVTATNVVVLFQKFRIDTKIEPGHARPVVTTLGKGKALVYQEGRVIKATWRKRGDTGPTRLFDADGKEIELVRGRTFFQVVPPGTRVTDSN